MNKSAAVLARLVVAAFFAAGAIAYPAVAQEKNPET